MPGQVTLADGARLRVRPIDPADRDPLAEAFARLSDQSRHRRFLAPKPRLTTRELEYLTDVDHVTHEALVAIDENTGQIVGVGRYATGTGGRWPTWRWRWPTPAAPRHRPRARGRSVDAHARTAPHLTGSTLADNLGRALLDRLGFRVARRRSARARVQSPGGPPRPVTPARRISGSSSRIAGELGKRASGDPRPCAW